MLPLAKITIVPDPLTENGKCDAVVDHRLTFAFGRLDQNALCIMLSGQQTRSTLAARTLLDSTLLLRLHFEPTQLRQSPHER